MKKNDNNRANQLNPNNINYWRSRGYSCRPENWNEIYNQEQQNKYRPQKHDLDNRSNQLNPNNIAYISSRYIMILI